MTSSDQHGSRQNEAERDVLSLDRVVRNVVSLLRRTIPKNITILARLGQPTHVEGHAAQLEQCLMNICLNARDALPDGGELQLETSRVVVDGPAALAAGVAPGSYGLLTCRDNGVGMDDATLQRVFDRAGSGLGLSLVVTAIKAHGGRVDIASELGKGTTVRVHLPATDAPLSVKQLPTRRAAPNEARGETILIVDDERHLREMAKRLLEGLGYRVLLAADGEQALCCYREHGGAINLVLLDVMLGSMDGAETFERLKAIDPQVRVLVSSGSSKNGEPANLLARGARGFIQKPYGIDEIDQAIRAALHD